MVVKRPRGLYRNRRRKMPKRKRRIKEKRAEVVLAPSSVKEGEDISSSELDEETEDLEFLQNSLAEGRAGFLSKMKLYVWDSQ